MHRTPILPTSLEPIAPTPRPRGGRRAVAKACNHCRVAHIACNEEERPCQRCVRLGRGHLCEDVPARKRGRPAWRLCKEESAEPQPQSSLSSSEDDAPTPPLPILKRRKITPMGSGDEEERDNADDCAVDRQTAVELKDSLIRLSELVMGVAEDLRTLQHSNKAFEQRMAAMEARLSALQRHHHQHLHHHLDPNRDSTSSSHPDHLTHPPQPHGSPLGSSATEAQLWTLRDGSTTAGQGWGAYCLSPTTLPSSLSSSSLSSSSSTPTPTSELVPFDSELAVLRSSLPEWSALEEMRQQLPFLSDYPLSPKNFVVSDTRYPIMASITTATAPVPYYANEAFTSLCGYTREELTGVPMNRLLSRGKNTHDHLRDILTARTPKGVSRVVYLRPLLRHRNGTTFRVNKRCQFFYNQHGEVYRCVVVINSWRPDQLAEGEVFGW